MNTYAQQLVTQDTEGFMFNVSTDEVYTTAGDGLWSDAVANVRVTDMGIYISTLADPDDRFNGDFYVLYDEATWNMDELGLIYTDSAFIANVQDKMRDVLLQMDVDDELANELVGDISYSEQGMQDYGRVSFDAYKLADYLYDYYAKELA